MGLTPAFKVIAESQDITDKIKQRLLELTVTDNSGNKTDTVEIRLDDENHALVLPSPQAKLEVWLGYKETSLEKLGTYIVDEVELSGPPNTLSIRAKSADMNQGLKEPKTRTWQKPGKEPERFKLTEIVETIAGDHSLSPLISDEFSQIDFEIVNQTNEHDMNLLTRLAGKVGAIAKPAGNYLLFLKKGESKSASGKSIPTITLSPKDVMSWNVSIAERGNFKKVIAKYRDTNESLEVEVTAGNSGPVYTISKQFKDKTEATDAAKAQLNAFLRGKNVVNLELPGNPALMAEAKLELVHFREGIDDTWVVESVTHKLSNQGYTASINANVVNKSAA